MKQSWLLTAFLFLGCDRFWSPFVDENPGYCPRDQPSCTPPGDFDLGLPDIPPTSGSWQIDPTARSETLRAVLGDDKGTIWAVGDGGRALVRSGNPQWRDISVLNWTGGGSLTALALFLSRGAYTALAVGDHGAYSELDASKSTPYQTLQAANTSNLTGLWSSGAFPMWATTREGQVWRVAEDYTYTMVAGISGDLGVASLYGVWDTDNGSAARVVGSNATIRSCTLAFCRNDLSELSSGRALRSIWGSDSENYWIAADGGLLRHWDGKNGINDITSVTQDLYHVQGIGNNVWAVGTRGTVVHLVGVNPYAWESVPGLPSNRDLYGVWISPLTDEVWVVGEGGLIAHRSSKRVL